MAETNAQFVSVEEAVTQGASKEAGIVKLWTAAVAAADKEEEDWRKEADEIVAIYRSSSEQKKQQAFNILYSNTETLLPAVFNSTPSPDIRRRYNDPGVAAKAVSDMLERGITYSLDQYDFDGHMRAVVFDAATGGRGVARVRYVPKVAGGEDPSQMTEGEGPESDAEETDEHKLTPVEPGEHVVSQTVQMEYVPWKNFRRGAGLVWDDVPWVAFKHYLTREQIEDLAGKALADAVSLDYDVRTGDRDKDKDNADGAKDAQDVFLRCCVLEIWDKPSGKVLFIAPGYEAKPLRVDDDPLQLTGFFPIPRPLCMLETPGNLVPVPPYRSYKELAEELNEVTIRIRRLVRQIRSRGIYASAAADIEQIIKADDGELVPAQGLEMFAQGGLDKAIAWWPIEAQAKVVTELVAHREAIKQTIYEVSGLSDILRGASAASATATAENIKNQWGSLRIQKVQAEVQRFCRDVFRMKAELIAQNFDLQILQDMTGVKLVPMAVKQQVQAELKQAAQMQAAQAQQMGQQPPSQAPQVPPDVQEILKAPTLEEVEQMLRSDVNRSYKIDVETDSTVRADLTRNQENMVQFVQGTAGYIQAVGPAVQAGLLPPDLAITIFGAFARNFRLGRQVDMALENASESAKEMAQQPKPQAPDPAMEKVKADVQAKQAELQMKAQEIAQQQQQHEAEMQMRAQELGVKAQELEIKRQESQQKVAIEQQKAADDAQAKFAKVETENDLARKAHETDTALKISQHQFDMQNAQKQAEFENQIRLQKAQADMETSRQIEGERLKADNARADKMAVTGTSKPKRRAVNFKRGADGRIAAAEIVE